MTFKRFVAAASASAILTAGVGVLPSTVPTQAADLTGLTAFQITSQMTVGWNLGNSLDCESTGYSSTASPSSFVTAWGNPEPSAALFRTVKEAGFNTVRIPTTWYEHIEWDESSQMYVVNETWMDYVKQTVDYAYDQGMFVILNVHHEDWINVSQFTDSTYAEAAEKLEDIWSQIAEEFADYDQHLIFEGMNEPRQTGLGSSVEWGSGDSQSRAYINKLNAVFVNTVRNQGSAANSERLLMLPGYCASSEYDALNGIEIPENSGNVAISVHAYAPYYFTMATDDKANHTFPGSSGWGESYETNLTTLFNRLKKISASKNVPVIIGEFGASDFNNTESRVAWAKSYLSKAKEAGIPCVLWDNNITSDGTGEAHGYLCRSDNTWYPDSEPVIEAMMEVYGISASQSSTEATEATETEQSTTEEGITGSDWSGISVGSNWIPLYYAKSGTEISAWGNAVVSDWQDYVNEDYELVLIYESQTEPYLVLQGGWYKIFSDDSRNTSNAMYFTYEDVTDTMQSNGVSLSDMYNLFISANSSEMTAYALYAVPVAEESVTEATTTEATTAAETTTTTEATTTPETTTTTEATTTPETTTTTEATTTPETTTTTEATTTSETTTTTEATTTSETTTTTEAATTPETTTTTEATTTPETTTTTEATTEIETTQTTEPTTQQETSYRKGDVNCDGRVTLTDLIALQRFMLATLRLDDTQLYAADVNADNSVDSFDLALLKRAVFRSK
jgi:aryl-phospho-beta-D-glucosidase BglC (GH1 family)